MENKLRIASLITLFFMLPLAACSQANIENNNDTQNSQPDLNKQIESVTVENAEVTQLGENHWKVYTDIIINAPADKVWSTLTDWNGTLDWSSSFKGVKGKIENGAEVEVLYQLNDVINKIPHTLIYKENYEFGWSDPMGGPVTGLVDNHIYRVEKISDSVTRFIQMDDFRGVTDTVYTAEALAKRTAESYPIFNRELKWEVEK